MRGMVLGVAWWSALTERVAAVQAGVGLLVMVDVLVIVVTVLEVRRVDRVVVIVDILRGISMLGCCGWSLNLRRECQCPFGDCRYGYS
jgi:hypothetical protein